MTLIQNGFAVLVLTVVSQASQLCFKEFSTEPSRILGGFFLCEGQCCNPRSTKTCCEVERCCVLLPEVKEKSAKKPAADVYSFGRTCRTSATRASPTYPAAISFSFGNTCRTSAI
ncbi:uncharacterized protein LOC124147555 isoform X2 [Haliotis rufescens]|uniref:uncharacterized protein LOC124147555 isoform X2 n=1 Tax=Haliotis rufescens TaxID=6454 RepID=UPI00201F204B|nr:uncharacterized protein LOC124147555 isoform X2 [Haliotis rufescens]